MAVDRDGPPYNRFIYALLPPDYDDVDAAFAIDPESGKIRTTRMLDRERQSIHRLTAVATELAHPHASSTANVTVFVADRNDNAPSVLQSASSNHTAVVSLYAAPGHVFARISATDPDWGLNARLRYAITGGDEPSAAGAFDVGANSGAVSVRRDLSVVLPADVTRLSLFIAVHDSGVPPLNTSVTLNVLVDRSTSSRDKSPRHGRLPVGNDSWLTSSFGAGEFRREFLILLAAGTAMLIIVLLLAIICIRRRQLAALAAGGVDQIQPRSRGRDDEKSLPAIVEVGWATDTEVTANCDPEFQIVRNIVDSPWENGRCDSALWKSSTLLSPSRMASARAHAAGDPESCYVTTPTSPLHASTTGRPHRAPPQLQTFSVSSIQCLLTRLRWFVD